jgi:hypothetical protein
MASFTVELNVRGTPQGVVSASKAYSEDAPAGFGPRSVANGASNFFVNIDLDVSHLKVFVLVSDQAITLETNDGGSPQETVSLLANVPLVWTHDSYHACPFSGDVTGFYFTNASGSAANVTCAHLQDPTA